MSTVLFYNRANGAGAVGDLTSNKLVTIKEFGQGSFGNWSHIVAHGSTLLFYRKETGAAAIGELKNGTFTTTKPYAAGSFAQWTHIVDTAAGCLFYNHMTGAAAIGALSPAGFITTGSHSNGALAAWTHIVADGSTVLFYNRLIGSGAVAMISPTGLTTKTSYGPGSFGEWTHVVNIGSQVLFLNRDTGGGAVGTLTPSGYTTTLTYNPGSFGVWTHVCASGDNVLFYNADAGNAAIGTLAGGKFTTATTYRAGEFSRWSHVTGESSSGPEDLAFRVGVLLCRWQPAGSTSTALSPDFYRHYFFDMSAPNGIGRYWFGETAGQMRFTGYVRDWINLSKAPSHPSIGFNRQNLAQLAINDALTGGWVPGDERALVVIVAAPGAAGVNAGAVGAPISVKGIDRHVAILHGDAANWIAGGGNVGASNFRFDFNAHEVGHVVGDVFSFNHAFGPNGPYDDPYCIMAAKSYGKLGGGVLYDAWNSRSGGTPEEHTKGPGLGGATRSACGWARSRSYSPADLKSDVDVYVAQLADQTSTLPQVLEFPVSVNGTNATYTIEFRSPVAEHDQSIAPTVVLSQREGSAWSTNGTWAPRSATFRGDALVASGSPLPSVAEPGIVRARVLQVGPPDGIGGLSGPSWIQLRLSKF